jgi:nicotinamidase-related amidase
VIFLIRPAIVLVDVQNDFVTGPLIVKRATDVIAPLQRLVAAARRNNLPIVYSVDAHYPQDVEVTKKWGRHAIKGTKGAEVIEDLEPDRIKDYVVEKRTCSAFYETGLEPLLKSMYKGDGAKNLLLGGLHTHLCVRHTAADAFFRGYQIIIHKDGVDAFPLEEQEQGLKYLEYVYDAKIILTNDIIKEIVDFNLGSN